jgi:hypothetical protein
MNENANKWVQALRSGKYKQTQGALTRVNKDGTAIHCCLGVACDLYLAEHPQFPVKEANDYRRLYGKGKLAAILPAEVQDWLGMATEAGEYRVDGYIYNSLAGRNDSGVPFEEIADIIEQEPRGLFR